MRFGLLPAQTPRKDKTQKFQISNNEAKSRETVICFGISALIHLSFKESSQNQERHETFFSRLTTIYGIYVYMLQVGLSV